ncbi:hypothetical protein M9Y10_020493 [Tritrichomonas musculus]|uniref:Protein kinase domain-containing protein n=1 Tax=Tritrichomonas musculus TaxID=1915356 RepID=A0ABR2HGC4_9EUKA
MVSREERFALKVYYPGALIVTNGDSDSDSNDDDDDAKEEKPVISADNARRFLLEYESINGLDHPNITKAYCISLGDRTHPPAILLEYSPSNLKKKIKKLSDSERISAIVDLSSAMKEVHSVGLCTLMGVEAETKSRTLKFMAPELLQERTDYDEKVDVYSFGVVVFLILTKGEFPDISVVDVVTDNNAEIPSYISKFSQNLIDKCRSFKASERPSFSEICETPQGNESKLI